LLANHLGAGHLPEGILTEEAIVAELLDVEQPSVGLEADRRAGRLCSRLPMVDDGRPA